MPRVPVPPRRPAGESFVESEVRGCPMPLTPNFLQYMGYLMGKHTQNLCMTGMLIGKDYDDGQHIFIRGGIVIPLLGHKSVLGGSNRTTVLVSVVVSRRALT